MQLDSVNNTYRLVVTIAHTQNPNAPPLIVTGNSLSTPGQRLLHFNGTLLFGALQTTFTSIDNDPPVIFVTAGLHVNTQLGVDSDSGFLVGNPTYTYGDGTDLSVRLRSNGNAELSAGSVPLDIPVGEEEKVANVRMELIGPATLPPGIAHRSAHYAADRIRFPVRHKRPFPQLKNHVQQRRAECAIPPRRRSELRAGGSFFCAEETSRCGSKPRRWSGESPGRFDVTTTGPGIHYVRQDEYATLDAAAPVLDNSQGAVKRSNEKYFRHANSVRRRSPCVPARTVKRCSLSK